MEPIQEEINLDLLSREEQKVIIAQDVIANIAAGIFIPKSGEYIEYVIDENGDSLTSIYAPVNMKGADVKSNFKKIKSCNVCALGACMISITKYKNQLTFGDLPQNTRGFGQKQQDLLLSVFTPEEITLIEVMFEGSYHEDLSNIGREVLNAIVDNDKILKALAVRDRITKTDERLVGIMQSIIDNQGMLVL